MNEAETETLRHIIQLLHEEQRWDEVSFLFLEYLSSNNGDFQNRESDLKKIAQIWKQTHPDKIWYLWKQWRALFTGDVNIHERQKNIKFIDFLREYCDSDSSNINSFADNRKRDKEYHSYSNPTVVKLPPKTTTNKVADKGIDITITNKVQKAKEKDRRENEFKNPLDTFDTIFEGKEDINIQNAPKFITHTAKWFQESIVDGAIPVVHTGLDNTGNFLKEKVLGENVKKEQQWIELKDMSSSSTQGDGEKKVEVSLKEKQRQIHELREKTPEEIVALDLSTNARRSTETVKEWTRSATDGLRNAAAESIQHLADQWEENKIGSHIIPMDEQRELCANIGKVGLAGLGATAVVAETIYNSTKTVAEKGIDVTADVVRHKCGDTAAQVVEDTGKSIGNILETVRLVATLGGGRMATSIARKTAKNMTINNEVDDSLDDYDSSSDSNSSDFEDVETFDPKMPKEKNMTSNNELDDSLDDSSSDSYSSDFEDVETFDPKMSKT